MEKDLFNVSLPYTVFDTDVGGDPVFSIFPEEEEISVGFTEFATANTVGQLGFRLIGLESVQDLAVGTLPECADLDETNCVAFNEWNTNPTSRPSITNDGGTQNLEWPDFTGGDPKLGSIANIRFLPEPSTTTLTTAGLAMLGLLRLATRRRRL
jgi:MYXO-CTERM domain-containing protein